MTHADVINYINKRYDENTNLYKLIGDTLHIYDWILFEEYPYTELPNKMIFHRSCDVSFSMIEKLPEDIVLHGDLYCNHSRMRTLPRSVKYIFINLNTCRDLNIYPGTFISKSIYSPKTKYEHLSNVRIDGFITNYGIIS